MGSIFVKMRNASPNPGYITNAFTTDSFLHFFSHTTLLENTPPSGGAHPSTSFAHLPSTPFSSFSLLDGSTHSNSPVIRSPSMKSADSDPHKKQKTAVPPRRGQIKAQIFGSLFETMSSVAGEAMTKLRGTGGSGGSGGAGSPASTNPPPSPSSDVGSPDSN